MVQGKILFLEILSHVATQLGRSILVTMACTQEAQICEHSCPQGKQISNPYTKVQVWNFTTTNPPIKWKVNCFFI